MNYHLMIDDKFIDDFIDDAEKVSSKNSNRYFIRGNRQNAIHVKHLKAEWVEDIWSNDFKAILNKITSSDKIFIHWYSLDVGKLMLTIDKNIPIYVICWGGDFYEDPYLYHINWIHDKLTLKYVRKKYIFPKKWAKRPNIFLKQLLTLLKNKRSIHEDFLLKKKTVQRINFMLIDPNLFHEIELIRKIYDAPKISQLPFGYNQNFDRAIKLKKYKKNNDFLNIQIGNSATGANNHMDCIKVLKKFKKEKIKLIIPLSYGRPDYAEVVKKYCTQVFNNKFEALEKFMPREEYLKKLNEIDVAIMFHNRSQALGNCITLLTLGKKLYLKNKNPLYQFFKTIGVDIFDIKTIKNLTFEEFSKPLSEEQTQSNIEKISNLFSEEKRLEYLSNILNNKNNL
ncbi:MAG: TDP-N-acetylfucosamine:lipid II N-acetylfucosaminyltransferase [Flavobacteriales bacterium]|nr:TDP-N-acetylfucosamine:lipid II N-acetylfucosaminyltransferase [Flavobacteriales bacterium]MCW8937706.1 TDP-N-acetylfucosamine:lipid II N-acetylfucosaminyltransferase [Flavobacteriales bacterium]MCW8968577.1 TDP-N-acetylfucosamine:lipid II N-acetylfucosaminyltransferase [Flavobacteriales bacterium]MCW8990194.1 TDP-N-acetylfucosamine:lipid II N-acetylfucosaminyltransferase [Flavobacteriales bacterium]MCW9019912.1 TDP-N-acetylfucosamine:lipid II N-acetylfucosaminyltransferase [Flavobacteriales